MFFFMLFLLGLDSEFALLETVLTVLYDGLPKTKDYKPLLVGLLCTFCFLLSLPCMSSSGPYVFQIMDDYGGGMSVLWIAIIEVAFIMWIYGVNNFSADLDFMLKIKTNIILKFLWVVIPFLLSLILGFSLYSFEAPKAKNSLGDVLYPDWVHGIGIFLIIIVVVQIPLWGVIMPLYYLCSPSRRLRDVTSPAPEWGPGDKKERKEWLVGRRRNTRPPAHTCQQQGGVYPAFYPGYSQTHM